MCIIVFNDEEADEEINNSSINKLFNRNFISQTLIILSISAPLLNLRNKSKNLNKNLIKYGSDNSYKNTKKCNIEFILLIIIYSYTLIKSILLINEITDYKQNNTLN
jgi:hypothetical protein